jgi:hypothetical protein
LAACSDHDQSKNSEGVQQNENGVEEITNDQTYPRGTIFRCDDCFGGLVASYFQCAIDDNRNVVGIWYWDNKNPEKTAMNITKQEFIAGEDSGWVGSFIFPGTKDKYEFGVIGDHFTLRTKEGDFWEYDYESFEE